MYQDRLYTEQYVLRALLSHSGRYRILLSTYYLSRTHPEVMRETFGEEVFGRGIVPPAPGRDTRFYGESFWFSVQGWSVTRLRRVGGYSKDGDCRRSHASMKYLGAQLISSAGMYRAPRP